MSQHMGCQWRGRDKLLSEISHFARQLARLIFSFRRLAEGPVFDKRMYAMKKEKRQTVITVRLMQRDVNLKRSKVSQECSLHECTSASEGCTFHHILDRIAQTKKKKKCVRENKIKNLQEDFGNILYLDRATFN